MAKDKPQWGDPDQPVEGGDLDRKREGDSSNEPRKSDRGGRREPRTPKH